MLNKEKLNANTVGGAAHSDPKTNKTTKFDCRGGRLCPPANKQNGITLIALIITIIVMLILVGVTINVALNGGLFGKADTAKKETNKAVEKEELSSAVVTAYDEKTGVISKSILETNLGTDWTVEGEEGGPYEVTTPKKNEFTVAQDGTINPKAPSNIKYVYGNEGSKGYIVILKNNDVFYAESGQKIPMGTYKTDVDITKLPKYNGCNIHEDIKAISIFIMGSDGSVAMGISDDKCNIYSIEHWGSNDNTGFYANVSLRQQTGKLMNDVDLSEYDF